MQTLAVTLAVILAAAGMWLTHCSRIRQIWRGLCPECQQIVYLPIRFCPLCGANFERWNNRTALASARTELIRRKRALFRRGQLLMVLALLSLLTAWLLAVDPSLLAY